MSYRLLPLVLALVGLCACSAAPAIVVAPTPEIDTIARARLAQSIRIEPSTATHDSLCNDSNQICLTGASAKMQNGLERLLPQLFDHVVSDSADYTATFDPMGLSTQFIRSGLLLTLQWRFRIVSRSGQTVVDMQRQTTTPTVISLLWGWSGFDVDPATASRAISAIETEAIANIADAVDQFTRGASK